jgi:triosephosphate isomerase (TIM)
MNMPNNKHIKPLIAGNWKMNGLSASIAEFELMLVQADGLVEKADLLICPPFTLIQSFAALGGAVNIGGQDCHFNESGAHTGDISAHMLADLGAKFIIVGHSERRSDHKETNETVQAKAKAAWNAGLVAIICVGETDSERVAGQTLAVVEAQLAGSVPEGATAANTVIAYEPVWAIGTGKTPTVDDVERVHAHIRAHVAKRFREQGTEMRLLYGGSVKPSNAAELLSVAHVNGALIGGASLKAADFIAIANAVI